MTKTWRCPDVERLLLEGEDRTLAAGERRLVDEHLGGCPRCRGFAADRAFIRDELRAVGWPEPPRELVSKTKRMIGEAEGTAPKALPAWVLVALAAVTIITSLWLAAWLPDIDPDVKAADLPVGAWAAVIIILENALMLFCAPVVLRTVRARRAGTEEPEPGGADMSFG